MNCEIFCGSGRIRSWVLGLVLAASAGCSYNMSKQPRYNPFAPSDFYSDGQSVRNPVPGTVPRDYSRRDAAFATTEKMPVPVTAELLKRGQERFDIFCSPCHGRLGDGEGIVVQRGFLHPPSYHTDRLRNAPDGLFYQVITDGFGKMASYGNRVPPDDRWAITAYIRALQLSQSTRVADLPPAEQQRIGSIR